MKLTITSIELKSVYKFFPLSLYAMRILNQLRVTNYLALKKKGLWTKHYTMTMWLDEKDLRTFASSGAHLEAMKKSAALAREIRTLTVDAEDFPDWKTARQMLAAQGRVVSYN